MLHLLLGSQLGSVHAEELIGLSWVLARHVMESRRGDVVGFALPHEAVVLENILLFRIVDFLRLEDPLCLTSNVRIWSVQGLDPICAGKTYSEIFSNSNV